MERSTAPRGRGRPPGSRNKRSVEVEQRVAAEGITPLDFMLNLMRDEGEDIARRLDAAKAAAQYVHPKLQSIEQKTDITTNGKDITKPKVVRLVPLTAPEVAADVRH